jgi:hypothetical protein
MTTSIVWAGKYHNLELTLEGMGGGGKVFLEVSFTTAEISNSHAKVYLIVHFSLAKIGICEYY